MLRPDLVTFGVAGAVFRIAGEMRRLLAYFDNPVIAKNQVKQADPPLTETPPPVTETESTKNILTTMQWLSVISIVVSLAGIYYKREEIKGLFTKNLPLSLPPVPPNSPVDFAPRRGIKHMD